VLRFFRKYFLNKYVLVVLGVVLMAVFGLDQALQALFQGSGPNLGTVHGKVIRVDDERQASSELRILSRFPVIGEVVSQTLVEGFDRSAEHEDDYPAMRWLMIQADAERMGLGVSQTQVDALLSAMGVDASSMQQFASSAGVPVAWVEQTLGKFIVMLDYADLVSGRSLARDGSSEVGAMTPQSKRLALLMGAVRQQQQGRPFEAFGLEMMSRGSFRLSDAVLASAALASRAGVAGAVVTVHADAVRDGAGAADDADPAVVQELFERYRDDLPGTGEPFGLGYRTPDRVKLEYLAFDLESVAESIEIDEADALGYFRQNRDRLREELGRADADYASARGRVMRELRGQRARARALELARDAQEVLSREQRSIKGSDGYPDPEADFEPTPLRVLADRLAEREGFRPEVSPFTTQWLSVGRLGAAGPIASSTIANRENAPFTTYVASAREFGDLEVENPALVLRPLRLAVGTPSQPMVGPDGSVYLFRLTDAEPTRAPETIDAVRELVERDARRVTAYRGLVDRLDELERLAVTEGLDGVASAFGADVRELPLMPRRVPSAGGQVAPPVPGLLDGAPVVDGMHATAREALSGEARSIEGVDPAERVGAVAEPTSLAVAVFRVDAYQTLTRAEYERFRGDPIARVMASFELVPADVPSPLSFESLARRTGFVHDED
jgi:hypothetical protein